MANPVTWKRESSITTEISTGLNSLANGSIAISADIDNTTNLYRWMTIFVNLASLTPTGTPYCNIALYESTDDGTTFADQSTSNLSAIVGTVYPSTATGAKHLVLRNVPIAPCHFYIGLENECGPALASSGNTVQVLFQDELIN